MSPRTGKILWVDDRPAYLVPSIEEVEKETKSVITSASTVNAALAFLLQEDFDLIITDVEENGVRLELIIQQNSAPDEPAQVFSSIFF